MTATSTTDREAARRAVDAFGAKPGTELILRAANGSRTAVSLPAGLADTVMGVLRGVAEESDDRELTTGEAAAYLVVSRPFLVKLLKEGRIPHRMVGSHHRIRKGDLRAFSNRQSELLEQSLAELAALGDELGV